MKRPVCKTTLTRHPGTRPPAGYTMVEILVATALMLTIMLGVAWVFGMVGETISDSRSSLEMTSQLRSVAARLKQDLDGVTVTMLPPCDPASNEGYFELTEGPIGPVILRQVGGEPYGVARNIDRSRVATASDPILYEVDTSVGDFDDILMFTTRGSGEPFIGRIVTRVDPVTAGLPANGQDDFDGGGPYDYAYVPSVIQSDVAEVAYFVRNGTLYRRQLLVSPDFPLIDLDARNAGFQTLAAMYYARYGFYNNDVSIRQEMRYNPATSSWEWIMAANTLGDLSKRENRFAHRPVVPATGLAAGFPYHPHWYQSAGFPTQTHWATFVGSVSPFLAPGLGLPTLEECSHPDWEAAGLLPNPVVNTSLTYLGYPYDAWVNPHIYDELDKDTGAMDTPPNEYAASTTTYPTRVGEDVVLTNVIGFDVKVWDPGAMLLPGVNTDGTRIPGVALAPGDLGYELAATYYTAGTVSEVGWGAYVDLGHGYGTSAFAGTGDPRSQLQRVYDTWSTHYESNWLDYNLNGLKDDVVVGVDTGDEDGDGFFDEGTDGMDSDANGVVDDAGEQEAPAPYPVPLRGIQIKIRVFEPDSRQIRERTIVCDFLPK